MALRFNNSNGAKTCDHCNKMITSGSRMILPRLITVNLANGKEAHFCGEAHLDAKIAKVTKALTRPKVQQDDICCADGLANMVALRAQIANAD